MIAVNNSALLQQNAEFFTTVPAQQSIPGEAAFNVNSSLNYA
jgi:hypothetical protein